MKNCLKLHWTCLLAMALVAGVASAAGEEAASADADLMTVVYDLSDVGPRAHGDVAELPLLPLDLRVRPRHDEGDDVYAYEMNERLSDYLESFVWDVLAPDALSVEGADVSMPEEDRLRLTAPAAVHASVRAVLEAIHAATHRRVVVEIEVYPMGSAAPLQEGGEPTEPGELLARRAEELVLGRTTVRRAEQVHPFVRDWEAEIAQRSIAGVPEVDAFSEGVIWMLRVEDGLVDGRYQLHWAQRTSEIVGWKERALEGQGEINADDKVIPRSLMGLLDQPRVAVTTTSGSRTLAVGDAITVLAQADSQGQGHGVLTRYRLVSVDPAPEPLRLPGGTELTVLDASAAWWGGLEPPAVEADQLAAPYLGSAEALPRLVFPSHDWEVGYAALETMGEAFESSSGDTSVWQLGPWRVLVGDAGAAAAARHALAGARPEGGAVTVEVGVEQRGLRGGRTVLGRLELPLRAGEAGLALAGVTGTTLRGFEVEVANSSAVADPTVGGFFDGLLVTARAHEDGTVTVDAMLHRLTKEEQVDLQTRFIGTQDRQVFHVLREQERLAADGKLHRWGGFGLSEAGSFELLVRVVPN